jgi:hypothetical protein
VVSEELERMGRAQAEQSRAEERSDSARQGKSGGGGARAGEQDGADRPTDRPTDRWQDATRSPQANRARQNKGGKGEKKRKDRVAGCCFPRAQVAICFLPPPYYHNRMDTRSHIHSCTAHAGRCGLSSSSLPLYIRSHSRVFTSLCSRAQ